MGEVSSKKQIVVSPHLGKYLVYVEGTKAAQNDTLTVSELSTVDVAFLYVGTTVETYTIGTGSNANKITLTSTTTGTVKGIVLGSK